ncbi:hypothetical protein OGAPHI_005336 [Ogataea philodendri]|uniref:Uncharacterized protein n=1 Tax=Ogataea philodendri TaxID=1378263 RepID=A0A9P8T278_9ASCO|nr:uncharacterized protein OGAPHI_005336 [Ogataea philodendri]KAH3663346.1 hypothetical protein OGAPHI_005336 [Ogataea philodendri]
MMECRGAQLAEYDLFNTSIKDLEKIFNFRIQLFEAPTTHTNELDSDLSLWFERVHAKGRLQHQQQQDCKRRKLLDTSATSTFLDDFELFRYRDEIKELREEVIASHYQLYIGKQRVRNTLNA